MNAIPMLIRCVLHQPAYSFVSRCACGEPLTGLVWRCATCALRLDAALADKHTNAPGRPGARGVKECSER